MRRSCSRERQARGSRGLRLGAGFRTTHPGGATGHGGEMPGVPRVCAVESMARMLSISPLSSDVATLRDALTGSVVLPGDDGWDAARQAWNLAVDQRPAFVALHHLQSHAPLMHRPFLLLAVFVVSVVSWCATAATQESKPESKPAFAGPIDQGFLLPNGWRLTPVGEQVPLTDLPLNIRTSADGKYAWSPQRLQRPRIDRDRPGNAEKGRNPNSRKAGLAWQRMRRPAGCGGRGAATQSFIASPGRHGKLEAKDAISSADQTRHPAAESKSLDGFRTGVCFDPRRAISIR